MTHPCDDVRVVEIDGRPAQHCRECGFVVRVYDRDAGPTDAHRESAAAAALERRAERALEEGRWGRCG